MDKDTASARKQAQTALQDKISAKVNILDQLASVALSTYQRNYHAANTIMRILGEPTLISRLNAAYVKEKFLSHEEAPGTFNERLTRFKALIRWGYERCHDCAEMEVPGRAYRPIRPPVRGSPGPPCGRHGSKAQTITVTKTLDPVHKIVTAPNTICSNRELYLHTTQRRKEADREQLKAVKIL